MLKLEVLGKKHDEVVDIYAGVSRWDADVFTNFRIVQVLLPVWLWRPLIAFFFNMRLYSPVFGAVGLFKILYALMLVVLAAGGGSDGRFLSGEAERSEYLWRFGLVLGLFILLVGFQGQKRLFWFLVDQVFDLDITERKKDPSVPRAEQFRKCRLFAPFVGQHFNTS